MPMAEQKYLITTAIDYVNDVIHIGHAYEKVVADALARYYRALHGNDKTFFLTGTDEHGQKVAQSAERAGLTPQEFTDKIAEQDKAEIVSLHVSFDRFIRTTDADHVAQAQAFWQKVSDKGDIYEAEYTGLYCVGDEAFLTSSDIMDGKCPNHPTLELKTITEKNYFFRLSAYQEFLTDYFKEHEGFVQSQLRRNEMIGFLERGLEDVAISRRKASVSWGIEVPNDPDQVIYVWFDALINYLTAGLQAGFWDDDTKIIHFVGKDINRWHSLLWPAMLASAGYKLPDTIVAHGFLSLNGQKISKSIGNVIKPSELTDKYGVDVVRYYLLRYTKLDADADLSLAHLEETYNADLANGLGNLVSRVAKLCETNKAANVHDPWDFAQVSDHYPEYRQAVESYDFNQALAEVWALIAKANQELSEQAPWTLAKKPGKEKEIAQILHQQIAYVLDIAELLLPFMPETAQKIRTQFSQKHIKLEQSLFPRLNP